MLMRRSQGGRPQGPDPMGAGRGPVNWLLLRSSACRVQRDIWVMGPEKRLSLRLMACTVMGFKRLVIRQHQFMLQVMTSRLAY